MLVISRNVGESIVVGDGDVCVHVIRFVHGRIRLGVECSRQIPIHRSEVYNAIKRRGEVEIASVGILPDVAETVRLWARQNNLDPDHAEDEVGRLLRSMMAGRQS
jgi:carbon storage regulator